MVIPFCTPGGKRVAITIRRGVIALPEMPRIKG
jgi:hypothetical protein